jgi:hypothetical protein
VSPLDEVEMLEQRQDEARQRAELDEVASVLRSLVTLLGLLEDSLLDLGAPRTRLEVASVNLVTGETTYRAVRR